MSKFKIPAASYLLITQDNQVLLLRRYNTGWKDGWYSLPAGHIEPGESATDCIIREAKEEVGITITTSDVQCATIIHRDAGDTPYIDFFFACHNWQGQITNTEPHKCDHLEFFPIDQLPDQTLDYVKQAITNSHDRIGYGEAGWQ